MKPLMNAPTWAAILGNGGASVWGLACSNGSVFVGGKDTAVVDAKNASRRRREEKREGEGGIGKKREQECASIPRLSWLVFLGHFVFWEMMLPLGKCLFS